MLIRRPLFFNQLSPDVSVSLARLAGLEGLARASLVGVIPLLALETFGSKDMIASVYFGSTIFTLLFTLNVNRLESWLKRSGLVTLGALLLIVSVFFYYSLIPPLFAAGIGIRAVAGSLFSVAMSLYIMDYIGKEELTQNETRRMLYVGTAWLIGPYLGTVLFEGNWSASIYFLSAGAAMAALLYFRKLRLVENGGMQLAPTKPARPLKAVSRFISQPRMRIAYLVTLSRSTFWVTLFVYGPIYVVEAGLPVWIGGALLSFVSGLLFFSPLVRRLADRFGTRQVIICCSSLIGASLLALGIIGEASPAGVLFWIIGALGGAAMDVLANIPFLRLVKKRERSEMTMVFTTWRESSSLLTQGLVFLTLLVAPFWVFYFVLAAIQFGNVLSSSFLPRRL